MTEIQSERLRTLGAVRGESRANAPRMLDIELYNVVLGVDAPWNVSAANLDVNARIAEVLVTYDGPHSCPVCNEPAREYDRRPIRWRHLDLCQYQFFVTAEVPRIDCPTHGLKHIPAVWAGLTWYPLTP